MQNRALLKLICSISYFYSFNLYLMSMQLQLIKLPCNLQLQNSLQLITGTRIKVLTEQVEDFQATFAHSFPFTPANPIRCFVMSHSEHVIPLFLHHPVLWALTWSLSPLTSSCCFSVNREFFIKEPVHSIIIIIIALLQR